MIRSISIRSIPLLLLFIGFFGSTTQAEDFPVEAFRRATQLEEKLALLPDLSRIPDEDALSTEMRYLVALHLVRPHLQWSTLHHPRKSMYESSRRRMLPRGNNFRWQPCHNGETWMVKDIPASLRLATKTMQAQNAEAKLNSEEGWYTWRVRNPNHADIQRALGLLRTVDEEPWKSKAERWEAELRRNNCVLTIDLAARFAAGEDAKILLDVRGTNNIQFEVFRVQDPKKMLAVCQRLGVDFMFRDYQLSELRVERIIREHLEPLQSLTERLSDASYPNRLPMPIFPPEQRTKHWSVNVVDLPSKTLTRNADVWHETSDDEVRRRFDDNCESFRTRIERRYQPLGQVFSSWRCDCLVTIPAEAIPEPGGYVLVATANGRRFFTPLLVDPLSLTLRRCDDGVLTQLSNHEGTESLADADILAIGQIGDATTDKNGIAWLRVLAKGDVAIVAHHQGRFAIGGFGDLFEGVYTSVDKDRLSHLLRAKELREISQREFLGDLPKQFLAVLPQRTHVKAYDTIRVFCVSREMKWTHTEGSEVTEFRSLERKMKPRLIVGNEVSFRVDGGDKVEGHIEFDPDGFAVTEFDTDQKRESGVRNFQGKQGSIANRVFEIATHEEPPGPSRIYKQDGLPRFHRLGEKLMIPPEMKVRHDGEHVVDFLQFHRPGWHHLECRHGGHRIFIYADQEIPIFPSVVESIPSEATWTNLSHEIEFQTESFWHRPQRDIWALFDERGAKAGNSFRILLRLPHRGARVLLLMEGKTVIDYKVVATEGLFQVIELPAKGDWGANFFLTAKLLSPSDEFIESAVPTRQQDFDIDEISRARLLHVKDDRVPKLPLKVSLLNPTPRAGKSGKFRLRVTNNAGLGKSARVVLAIIARPQQELDRYEPDTPVHAFASVFTLRYDHPTFSKKSWRYASGVQTRQSLEHETLPEQQAEQLRKLRDIKRIRPVLTQTYSAPALIPASGAINTHQGRDDDVWLTEIQTDAAGFADISVIWPALDDRDAGFRMSGIAIAGDDEIGVFDERIMRSTQ